MVVAGRAPDAAAADGAVGGRGLAARRGRAPPGRRFRAVSLSDGDTVVVAGAAGGVGVFAVQLRGEARRDRDRDRGRVQARAGCVRTSRAGALRRRRRGSDPRRRAGSASTRSSISSAAATSSWRWRSASRPTGSTRSRTSRRSPSTASRATAAPPERARRRSAELAGRVAERDARGADRGDLSARAGARGLRRARAGSHAWARSCSCRELQGSARRGDPRTRARGSGGLSCAPTATSRRGRRASPGRSCLRHGDDELPWHRIVRADGSLAKGRRQRRLLVAEGVPFRGERVDMRVARVPW